MNAEEYDRLLEEQRAVMNNLSKGDVSHVKGYFSLTEDERDLFLIVYKKHLSGMGTVLRQKYMPSCLKEVKWDKKKQTVNVYFESDWYHYTSDHTWY